VTHTRAVSVALTVSLTGYSVRVALTDSVLQLRLGLESGFIHSH